MASNSKLTKEQKTARKDMLAVLPKGSSMALSMTGITVLIVPDGAVDRVFTSVASPDEVKIRRKVGEFHALCRWFDDKGGFVMPAGFLTADQFADKLSE